MARIHSSQGTVALSPRLPTSCPRHGAGRETHPYCGHSHLQKLRISLWTLTGPRGKRIFAPTSQVRHLIPRGLNCDKIFHSRLIKHYCCLTLKLENSRSQRRDVVEPRQNRGFACIEGTAAISWKSRQNCSQRRWHHVDSKPEKNPTAFSSTESSPSLSEHRPKRKGGKEIYHQKRT